MLELKGCRMKGKKGKCAICGKYGLLTFEHIPPCSAFNNKPAKPVSGVDLLTDVGANNSMRMPWETDDLSYTNLQRGMGKHSLCSDCNNKTGKWYGNEYVKFARTISKAIEEYKGFPEGYVELEGVYPLRFIKQVVSMFCSCTSSEDASIDELRSFVLDRDKTGIDTKKHKIYMYITSSTLHKQTGNMLVLKGSSAPYIMKLNEITAYPFGFTLYYNPQDQWEFSGFDITSFADCKFDECCNITFPWKVFEMNNIMPGDFRTKEEIEAAIRSQSSDENN